LRVGTRTSSRNVSQNSASPVIWRNGRGETPGVSIGTMNMVSPECFGTSQSVRAMHIAISER